MDTHLDDPLNMECSMGVDFEHAEDAVVSEADMTLVHSGHEESIPMEFDHSEVQPILMDGGSEEIIVPDFMGDQFSLQEYSVQSDQITELTTTVESNQQQHILTNPSETMIDLQFPQPQLLTTIKQEPQVQHKIIAVKTVSPMRRKNETVTAPRQVAIAPKPPKLAPAKFQSKHLAIAPKPVSMAKKAGASLVKKVSLGSMPSNSKGNKVLGNLTLKAQIGKQLIIVPSSGAQKIKIVSTSNVIPSLQYIRADSEQAQLLSTKTVTCTQTKPVMTKLIAVHGQSQAETAQQPVVISKIGSNKTPRFLMQQKTLPISLTNKVLLATPSKQGVKLAKKQEIIAIKSPTPKLMPATAISATPSIGGKQKVMVAASSGHNVILKPAPAKTTQVGSDGRIVVEGQRTQLHQINVPGKGIQYFRLVTNSSTPKPAPKSLVALPSKTFMITDNKGNLIPVTADKMVAGSGQPPSLVLSGNTTTTTLTKVAAPKPGQKLVRIAPITPKIVQTVSQVPRSSQSLLAPLSPVTDNVMGDIEDSQGEEMYGKSEEEEVEEHVDSKTALRALIEKAVEEGNVNEVEVEFNNQHSLSEDNSMDGLHLQNDSSEHQDHPLIVIPSSYDNNTSDMISPDQQRELDDSQNISSSINVENDESNAFQSPNTPVHSEPDVGATDLGLRPRKACNCTKSQCLKLYCDCFANGEFCNRCNCNNCHNNLENEELRQKAIRGCLERNPNAFRPKIGKAKLGGPDIIRRHNKGCNCKRSGCLKNYCECYEAKIACTSICKCVGCRNVEETLNRALRRDSRTQRPASFRPPPLASAKQPCSFMTTEVIEAVCQCLIAAAVDKEESERDLDPMRDVIEEFARCLQDIISAAQQSSPLELDEGSA